jgi:hypothetical protein
MLVFLALKLALGIDTRAMVLSYVLDSRPVELFTSGRWPGGSSSSFHETEYTTSYGKISHVRTPWVMVDKSGSDKPPTGDPPVLGISGCSLFAVWTRLFLFVASYGVYGSSVVST